MYVHREFYSLIFIYFYRRQQRFSKREPYAEDRIAANTSCSSTPTSPKRKDMTLPTIKPSVIL